MQHITGATLDLDITVVHNVTVLPRMLQVISRRGMVMTKLSTDQIAGGRAVLHCSIESPVRWHKTIAPLLERLIDVESVVVIDKGSS